MNFTEEARAVYMNHCLHGSTEPEFIQAIAAALQSVYERGEQSGPAPQPRVKPLVWAEDGREGWISAHGIYGRVRSVSADHPNLEDIKAAAQADYETRILSALERAPAIPAGYDELLKAAKHVEKWWLEDGMKSFNGAPYAIFAIRSAIAKAAPTPEKENE